MEFITHRQQSHCRKWGQAQRPHGKGYRRGKGMINSKQKGNRYEREIASQLKEYGYDARRTAQYCGKSGDAADVIGIAGVHIEAKHCEQFRIYDWMAQATRDSEGTGNIPTVWFRKNHCETLVCMKMSDFLELYGETERGQKNGKIQSRTHDILE